jgi:Sec-independent protein secretion pathway component TatC
MERRRWLNQSQPQTLVIACFLLYLNAAFALLAALGTSFAGVDALVVLVLLLGVVAAYQIANERRWGYYLAIGVAISPFVLRAALNSNHSPFAGAGVIDLIFEIALLALLLHTESREYQKVWFK